MSGKFFAACIVISILFHAVILFSVSLSRPGKGISEIEPVFVSLIQRMAPGKAGEQVRGVISSKTGESVSRKREVIEAPSSGVAPNKNETTTDSGTSGTGPDGLVMPQGLTQAPAGTGGAGIPEGDLSSGRGSGGENLETAMSGRYSGPMSIKKARPVGSIDIRYDETSRRRGEEGTVCARARIGRKGEVISLKVESSSGYPRLDRIALNAIRSARFSPTYRNGYPVESEVEYRIVFRLEEKSSLRIFEDDQVKILE